MRGEASCKKAQIYQSKSLRAFANRFPQWISAHPKKGWEHARAICNGKQHRALLRVASYANTSLLTPTGDEPGRRVHRRGNLPANPFIRMAYGGQLW